MTVHPTNATRRPFLPRGASAPRRAVAVLVAAAGLVVGLMSASPATAQTTPTPEPSPPAQQQRSPSPGAGQPLEIRSPSDAEFIGRNSVDAGGLAGAGNIVRLFAGGSSTALCEDEVDAEGDWSCADVPLTNGRQQLTAREFERGETDPYASSEITVSVLGAPGIDGSDPVLTTGLVTGSAVPNAAIRISVDGGQPLPCPNALPSGYWSCSIGSEPADGDYRVRASQGSGEPDEFSDFSGTRLVRVDRTAPTSPAITAPTPGARIASQPAEYSGTGEDGASIEVFVDGMMLCAAEVSGGRWACHGTNVPNGQHTVQALQRDAAGNFSAPSTPMTVEYGRAPQPAPAPPPAGVAPSPAPSPGSPTPTPTPAPSDTPRPTPSPSESSPTPSPIPAPPGTNWGSPTGFGEHIAGPQGGLVDTAGLGWLALGAAFILFVALPLRMLATLLAGRIRLPAARLTGRNHSHRVEDEPLVRPWVVVVGAVLGAAVIATLSGGVDAEVRYLRLIVAIGIGLALLNGIGVAATSWAAGRIAGTRVSLRLVPSYLLVAAVAAIVSRAAAIDPPILIGVIMAAASVGAGVRARGGVALAQLAAVTVLATAAWLGHGALGEPVGFWAALGSEVLATVCITGLGSAALLVLPVSTLPGRALFEWTKAGWAAAALTIVAVASAALASSVAFPTLSLVIAAAAFAALALAAWAWLRYVEPVRR